MYKIPATKAWIWLNPADRCETFYVKRQRSGAAPISLRLSRRKATLGISDFAVLGARDTSNSWISLMHVWQPRYGVSLRSYFVTYLKNLSWGLNQIYRTHTARMHASTNTHSQLNDRYKDAWGQVQSVLSNSHVWSFLVQLMLNFTSTTSRDFHENSVTDSTLLYKDGRVPLVPTGPECTPSALQCKLLKELLTAGTKWKLEWRSNNKIYLDPVFYLGWHKIVITHRYLPPKYTWFISINTMHDSLYPYIAMWKVQCSM